MLNKKQIKTVHVMVWLGLWTVERSMSLPWLTTSFGTDWLHEKLLREQEVDDKHHAPCCPANHYHRRRLVFYNCTCGAVPGDSDD